MRLPQINWLHSRFPLFLISITMTLTIIRLLTLSPQDKIDLGKIWSRNEKALSEIPADILLYAARFNDRLLGAVKIRQDAETGLLDALAVREITRRRGVGRYLVEEVMRDNPTIVRWQLNVDNAASPAALTAFMQALNFQLSDDGWGKNIQ